MPEDRKQDDEDEEAKEIVLALVLKIEDPRERKLALHWLTRAAAALRYLKAIRISGA
jgi:hypothetical protein